MSKIPGPYKHTHVRWHYSWNHRSYMNSWCDFSDCTQGGRTLPAPEHQGLTESAHYETLLTLGHNMGASAGIPAPPPCSTKQGAFSGPILG